MHQRSFSKHIEMLFGVLAQRQTTFKRISFLRAPAAYETFIAMMQIGPEDTLQPFKSPCCSLKAGRLVFPLFGHHGRPQVVVDGIS